MTIYVDINSVFDGDGSKDRPFRQIQQAAAAAMPGDTVMVMPGIYREYVHPVHKGTAEAPISYVSAEPLGAVITGAEELKYWERTENGLWKTSVDNGIFGAYNPYTTYVYGDWYFAGRTRHTGCVFLNDNMMYEALTMEECAAGEIYPCSWEPEASRFKWISFQEDGRTVFYANFGSLDPNEEKVEISVRRECFFPEVTGIDYIRVSGFVICKAATTWAPPAAFQDGMIGPHWSKGWIIENCEIYGSKCAGISIGKYLDPENDHYFTVKHVKSPTQMERDAVCRGQYHGWLKENIGSHIIRRNNIHNCEQGGIIGRMGGVFSLIEDNHIHHINMMHELGGAEIAGIKIHAAIDVVMRRNHIHHCTMGIWTDWEAQGTRISQNILHHNQMPDFAEPLRGGMQSQDIFVEVSHGPTLIDNNLLLSDASLRFATQGVALVHNLILGAFTCVGDGTGPRYTPYHIPHRTEVMGFMTILHGDDRFYNNIFLQHYPPEDKVFRSDSNPDRMLPENRITGTAVFDEYPTYEEWISHFDIDDPTPVMWALAKWHDGHLPVWADGNVYLCGAKAWKHEGRKLVLDGPASFELEEKDGRWYISTDIYDLIKDFTVSMIDSDTLGKAFEPEERFEDPDGSPITFDTDYFGSHRDLYVIPGPFASALTSDRPVW